MSTSITIYTYQQYHIRGLFGGDFNLAAWQIFIGSPNLNPAILAHTRNELIYLPFHQIKMTPTLLLNKSPNIQLAIKSTYTVYDPSNKWQA